MSDINYPNLHYTIHTLNGNACKYFLTLYNNIVDNQSYIPGNINIVNFHKLNNYSIIFHRIYSTFHHIIYTHLDFYIQYNNDIMNKLPHKFHLINNNFCLLSHIRYIHYSKNVDKFYNFNHDKLYIHVKFHFDKMHFKDNRRHKLYYVNNYYILYIHSNLYIYYNFKHIININLY